MQPQSLPSAQDVFFIMPSRSTLALFAVLLTWQFDTIKGACDDKFTRCAQYPALCASASIRESCPKTCKTCESNLCTENNGGCDQVCTWANEAVSCSCRSGFRLENDNKTCVDIDECTERPNPCFIGLPVYCVNTVGSYSCQTYKCKLPGEMNYYKSPKCCKATNGRCGTTESIRDRYLETRLLATPTVTRIFGGTNAGLSSWPWQAQILNNGAPHCGGSLITDRWVLSAAHCFTSSSYENMFVYLGQILSASLDSVDITRRVQRTIEQLITHAEYSADFRNDVALLKLNSPVQSNDIISPVCLPCGETPEPGVKCWVTGFGRTNPSDFSGSEVLQEVDVPIVDPEKCRKAYAGHATIYTDKMLCAGYDAGKKDACNGDSGGPLVCQRADSCEWYVSGVVSFGKGCALAGYYGIYANVINYEAWIREQLGDDSANLCSKIYNQCRGRKDKDTDCETKLDKCETFPKYMKANCALTCCKLQIGEISNCFDNSGMTNICHIYSNKCRDPTLLTFMEENCKKTCNFC